MDPNIYPIQYIDPILLTDGTLVQLRPIHPIDGSRAEVFKKKLSAESIYNRFLGYIPIISPKLVERLTNIDYSKDMAIVAEVHPENKGKEVIAVARIASEKGQHTETEFAIIIADEWQGKGLGKILTQYMIYVAKDMGFEKIYALVFSDNTQMLEILRKNGFTFTPEDDTTTTRAERVL